MIAGRRHAHALIIGPGVSRCSASRARAVIPVLSSPHGSMHGMIIIVSVVSGRIIMVSAISLIRDLLRGNDAVSLRVKLNIEQRFLAGTPFAVLVRIGKSLNSSGLSKLDANMSLNEFGGVQVVGKFRQDFFSDLRLFRFVRVQFLGRVQSLGRIALFSRFALDRFVKNRQDFVQVNDFLMATRTASGKQSRSG